MNPRRRRRLRSQRKQRQQLHHAVWDAVHSADRSRRAQQDKAARDAEQKAGPGVQVIPEHALAAAERYRRHSQAAGLADMNAILTRTTGWEKR